MDYDVLLIWTAMTMAHFGCFRSGEFTINGPFDSNIHLCRNDVTFQNVLSNYYMIVHLKVSKTDRNNKGVDVTIGCTGKPICAYCSMLRFCLARDLHSNHIQPLFIYPDAKVLSRHLFVTLTKQYISQIGLNSELYSGHSFRIGGATSAALSGLNDWQIKKLGRWNSNVYLRYIQPSNQYFPQSTHM